MSKEQRVLDELAAFTDELYVRYRVALGLKQSRLIREGLRAARARGRQLGRPTTIVPIEAYPILADRGMSVREGARRAGMKRSTFQRYRQEGERGLTDATYVPKRLCYREYIDWLRRRPRAVA